MKKIIRLTESELHKLVKESVCNIMLQEGWKSNTAAALSSLLLGMQSPKAENLPTNNLPQDIELSTGKEKTPDVSNSESLIDDFISRNLKYPSIAEENGIEGRVIVSFVLGKDGSISNVFALKKVHPLLDKEAIRIVKSIPKWMLSGKNDSKSGIRYTIPINFKINR
jgi:TonB family protein